MRDITKRNFWLLLGFMLSLLIIPAFAFAGSEATATSGAGADASAISSPVINQGATSSLSLTQTSPAADPSIGRQLPEPMILAYPSPVPWFGPFNSSWTSNIDFGGKDIFTKKELLEIGTAWGATISIDWLKKVDYYFESIRLVILEPILKDNKLYAPKVKINGDGEVAGYVDGVATSKSTTIRKLLVEAMLKAMEGGANCLVVNNFGNLFEVEAWSVGLSGGGSISGLTGHDKQAGLGGSVQGGTFYGKSKANAEPWFNAVALRIGKMANKASVSEVIAPEPVKVPMKSAQELAKEKDFSNIPTGTYDPARMKK
jgi:hypothetical protein